MLMFLFLSAGVVVGVEESTAYSWPACSRCGSDSLQMSDERFVQSKCLDESYSAK